ncbi:MAG: hypothetical protein GX488_06790, partial [Clostridiales bacterium]|nr:hypothetical protein [Clostridiales bacterium]
MKKRIFSIAMSVLLMLSLCGGAFAAGGTSSQQANSVIAPKASAYLSSYRVTLTPKANHRMAIDALVYGTSIMDKIGISVIKIDEKKNGEWSSYDTLYAIDHPEFYQYNT